MEEQDRFLELTNQIFIADSDILEEEVNAVEGAVEQGELSLKVLMVTENFIMLKARKIGRAHV